MHDPSAILVEGDPGLAGAAVLTAAFALLAGSTAWFSRRDVH